MTVILVLLASILSGIFYRAGGSGNYPRQARIVGVAILTCLTLIALGIYTWWLILVMGLSCGALASSWQQDEKKWGFWAHGLGLSLALLPIAFVTHHWLGFGIRTIVLTTFITLWSQFTKWDILEESGRGAGIILSLPLLLI